MARKTKKQKKEEAQEKQQKEDMYRSILKVAKPETVGQIINAATTLRNNCRRCYSNQKRFSKNPHESNQRRITLDTASYIMTKLDLAGFEEERDIVDDYLKACDNCEKGNDTGPKYAVDILERVRNVMRIYKEMKKDDSQTGPESR